MLDIKLLRDLNFLQGTMKTNYSIFLKNSKKRSFFLPGIVTIIIKILAQGLGRFLSCGPRKPEETLKTSKISKIWIFGLSRYQKSNFFLSGISTTSSSYPRSHGGIGS